MKKQFKDSNKILNNVRVMILAAGEGTRLQPLTYHLPKPLNPIVNKPVLAHTLEKLAGEGVREVVINISYFPEMIKNYFGDGSRFGLRINYSYEKKALGTAGGVKKVQDFFTSTFAIVSGDGLSAIDLEKAVRFHTKKKSLGTIVLSTVDMKYEYGVVLTDKKGKIKKFLEKPTWNSMFPSAVNTGVYIFEPEIFKYIPQNKYYDFGCQVWPDLLKKKKNIYAYLSKEYWCDIGDLDVYKRAHKDVMDGRVPARITGKEIQKNVWVGEKSFIGQDVLFIPPCIIGSYCRINDGCRIGPYASIGDSTSIGLHAQIRDSVVWHNVTIDRNMKISDSIITNDVVIGGDQLLIKNAAIAKETN